MTGCRPVKADILACGDMIRGWPKPDIGVANGLCTSGGNQVRHTSMVGIAAIVATPTLNMVGKKLKGWHPRRQGRP